MRYLRMIGRRLLMAVPILFIVSVFTFMLIMLLPGDAARILAGGEAATPDQVEAVRTQLGLNDPALVQYARWLGGAVRLDFGESLYTSRPVWQEITARMPPTLSIALVAVAVALPLGMGLGVLAGARPRTLTDKLSIGLATVAVSIPSFVIAIMLVRTFAIRWKLLPAVGYVGFTESFTGWFKSVLLPGFALGALAAGSLSRQLRSGLISSVSSDYVRTAWAMGSGPARAIGKHALRNSAIPAATVFGAQLTFLIGGTVIIEQIFAINGVGTYMFQATSRLDLPAIQGVIIWYVLIQVTVYLCLDIVLAVLNPKLDIR